MTQKSKKYLRAAGLAFALFAVLLVLILKVDVKPIGPEGSSIGCAGINKLFSELTGVRMTWYKITNLLGLAAIAVCGCFGILGLCQWKQRDDFNKVDKNIILLGCFYILVMAAYVFFEIVEINYRPVIMDEGLEASFPSSHTMLTICVMASTITQTGYYLKNKTAKKSVDTVCIIIMIVAVAGRLLSGVHWFTDILAGVLLSIALVDLYKAVLCLQGKKEQ